MFPRRYFPGGPSGGAAPPVAAPAGVGAVQGGTVAVAAGVTAVQVPGTFVVPYEVSIALGWASDHWILPADKLATSFTVNFNVPPVAASSFDWGVLGS